VVFLSTAQQQMSCAVSTKHASTKSTAQSTDFTYKVDISVVESVFVHTFRYKLHASQPSNLQPVDPTMRMQRVRQSASYAPATTTDYGVPAHGVHNNRFLSHTTCKREHCPAAGRRRGDAVPTTSNPILHETKLKHHAFARTLRVGTCKPNDTKCC
jgi:hypothetical protein